MRKFYTKFDYLNKFFYTFVVSDRDICLQIFQDSEKCHLFHNSTNNIIAADAETIDKFPLSEDEMITIIMKEIDEIVRITNSEKLKSVSDFGKMVHYEIEEYIDDEGDDIFKGLEIMKKYVRNVVTCASHESIFGADIRECINKGITIQDCKHLVHLGWCSEEGGFVHFV